MKKKTIRILRIIVIAILVMTAAVIMVCVVSHFTDRAKKDVDTTQYDEYVCYDRQLRFVESGPKRLYGKYDDERSGGGYISYYALPHESEDAFVGAVVIDNVLPLYGVQSRLLLQPATDPIDVLSSWSMERISLYLHIEYSSTKTKDETVAKTEDAEILSDFKSVLSASSSEPDSLSYVCRLRLDFSESRDVYWECQVYKDGNGTYYVRQESASPEDIYGDGRSFQYLMISRDSALHAFLEDTAPSLKEIMQNEPVLH